MPTRPTITHDVCEVQRMFFQLHFFLSLHLKKTKGRYCPHISSMFYTYIRTYIFKQNSDSSLGSSRKQPLPSESKKKENIQIDSWEIIKHLFCLSPHTN